MTLREDIFENLRITMDNFRCLDKDQVWGIIDEFLEAATVVNSRYIRYDGKLFEKHMFVVQIKRAINGRGVVNE